MSAAVVAEPLSLPDPNARPQAAVVIYDGQCNFCRGQVARLARWDRGGRLAYLSLHNPEVAERYPDLTHEQLMAEMYVVTPTGERHHGAGAFRYLTRLLPQLYWLAPLMHLPLMLPVYQWVYRRIAAQRYRWGRVEECDNGACAVHFKNR